MNFERKGMKGNNWMHLFFATILIVSLVYVVNFAGAWGGHILSDNETRIVNYSKIFGVVNEDVTQNYNISINNSGIFNISMVNITLWGNFRFDNKATGALIGSNGTGNISAPMTAIFSNTSDELTWKNNTAIPNDQLVNGTITGATSGANSTFFWFNATALTPGLFNITVRIFQNSSAGIPALYNETNISIRVNDTSAPYQINITNTSKGRIWSNGNYSGSFEFNASVLDNYLTGAGISTIGVRVFINITNSSGQQNATITLSNVSGNYWNGTINTAQFPDGVYNISVWVNDTSNNLNNSASSFNVTFDQTNPTASVVCSPATLKTGDVVTCTCSPSDPTSGINSSATSITANPSTSNTGTFSESCSFADMAGNTGSTSTTYIVEQSGSGATSSTGTSSGSQVAVTSTDDTAATEKSYTFTTITPGTPAVKSDFNADAGISEIILEVSEAASDVMVIVTEHDGKPSAVSVAKNGEIYKYLQIETENLDGKLEKATIKVQVEKSWVSGNVEDMNDVAVFKFDGSDWNELTTTYDSEDDTYYYYTAEVSSFSYFAIGEKAVEAGEEATTTGTVPEGSSKFMWIAIAIILLAIIVGGGVAWKKNKGQ